MKAAVKKSSSGTNYIEIPSKIAEDFICLLFMGGTSGKYYKNLFT